MKEVKMNMPLQGYRVLDWTQWQAGPGAAMLLGDLGADVIKIEDRVAGDPSRGVEQLGATAKEIRRQAYFESNNRNKRGIALDLRKQKGRDVVYRLVEKSDAFITNFRESAATRYGLDYETLSKRNPKLIYGIISGYGLKGPDSDVRSFDGLGQARAGIMFACHPDEPYYIVGGIADAAAGIMAAFGVVVALLTRERQGIGQKVEASILSSMLFQQWVSLGFKFISRQPLLPQPRNEPTNPLSNLYKCADGRWIFLFHPPSDKFWPNVCRALGIEGLQNDPKFENMWKRQENSKELVSILDKVFATKPSQEWMGSLRENDCVCERLNTLDDLLTDLQVLANNYLPEFDHPTYGKTIYAPIPFELSKTPGTLRLPAPEFGQHTEEVLMKILGCTWEDIAKLRNEEVI
jgi:crotonobetainyl-CoA:carnitine CoA-transferase CaiB-like acyl-CoA transferase